MTLILQTLTAPENQHQGMLRSISEICAGHMRILTMLYPSDGVVIRKLLAVTDCVKRCNVMCIRL